MSMSPATGQRQSEDDSQWAENRFPVGLTMAIRSDYYLSGYDEGNWNGSYANGARLMAAYLGTINNLGTAIEKNASQTMKVTYTLKDVAETSSSDDTGDTTTTEATT